LEKVDKQRREANWLYQEAQKNRYRAEANFRMIRAAATQLLHKLRDNRLANVREIDTVRQVLAEELHHFFKALVHEESNDPSVRFETGLAFMLMGNVYRVQGQCSNCERYYEKAIDIFESLVKDFAKDAVYQGELALSYDSLGRFLADRGLSTEAVAPLQKAGEHYRASLACKTSGCNVCILNDYAWFLATCPQKSLRDPAQALEQAKRAQSMAPEWGESWNTLGVAYYRVGDWDEAIQTLKRSMELRSGGDAFDWFFLAMAYYQKKDKIKAEEWYNQAVQELGQTNTYVYEPIFQYHAEAAALLGKKPPNSKDKCGGSE
jgi:tetratricopeptide (TPR) repeat protein